MELVKVPKKEFYQFIYGFQKLYNKKLCYDVTGICEPPIGTYNDFSEGKVWPDSVIAKITLNHMMIGHPLYDYKQDEYYICKEA